MILDNLKNRNAEDLVTINNIPVSSVIYYKYLGIIIQDNLKWNLHVEAQVKKANRRVSHVRCLKKTQIDYKLLCLFSNSVISSVLTYGIPSWFARCDKKLNQWTSLHRLKWDSNIVYIYNSACHVYYKFPFGQ